MTTTKHRTAKLLLGALLLSSVASAPALAGGERPSIGGTVVPRSLSCQEDEVIFFAAKGEGERPLKCVHLGAIVRRYRSEG